MKKRVAVIYRSGFTNEFVLRQIEKLEVDLLLVREESTTWSIFKRIVSRSSQSFLTKVGQIGFLFLYWAVLNKPIERRMQSALGKQIVAKPDIAVSNLNSSELIKKIEGFDPTIVLLLGTDILGKIWLQSKLPLINLHTGITPTFRGRFCWFWPIATGRYDCWGVTAHIVSKKVDTGSIISQRREDPRATTDCSLSGLLTRISTLSAEVCMETVANTKICPSSIRKFDNSEIGMHYMEPTIFDYLKFLADRCNYRAR